MTTASQHRKLIKIASITVSSAVITIGTTFLPVNNKVTAQRTYNSYGEYCRNYDNLTSAATKATVKYLTERATIQAAENPDRPVASVKKQWDEVVNTDLCYEVEPHLQQFEQIGNYDEDSTNIGIHLNSTDLEPLIGLNRLKGLSVNCKGEAQNLSAISSLSSLEDLELINCVISDIAPLSSLTNLQELDLEGNSVTDLTPLATLTNLERLNLTHQTDSELKKLAIARNPNSSNQLPEGGMIPGILEDVSPLASMTNLRYLTLSNNNITDVSPLNSLVKLVELNLAGNNISDISSLTALTSLTSLDVANNHIPENARVCPIRESSCKGLESSYQKEVAENPEQRETTSTDADLSAPQVDTNPAPTQEQPTTPSESQRSIEDAIESAPEKILDSIF